MTKTLGLLWRATLTAGVIAVMTGLTAQQMRAATVYVGSCVANVTTYSTIQAAVNNLKATTIRVCPGNYPEQVIITRNLTLTGIASGTADNPTVVIPSGGFVANTTALTNGSAIAAQILAESPATDVTISYLAVDGTGSNLNSGCSEPPLIGIYYQGASGTVNHVAARNQAQNAENFGCASSAALGIFVESGNSENSTVTIKNSTVLGYQKNGITANETGTTVTINGNSVVGAGPINAAQNSIQAAFGATGIIENNTLADDDFNGDISEGFGAGILIYGSGDMRIAGNSVANTQTGIVTVTDGSLTADGNTILNNLVTNTHVGDGIDLCSNNNTVTGNTVFSSDDAGIHLDSSCGSTGSNSRLNRNTVNDACAGILLGGSGNTVGMNTFANVANTTLTGDVCTAPSVSSASVTNKALVRNQVTSRRHSYYPVRP